MKINNAHLPIMMNSSTEAILKIRLAGQPFGLRIPDVAQIVEMVAIVRIPQMPDFIQGLINVHGRITPVLDLRQRFDLTMTPYHLFTPIILVESDGCLLALVVDQVEEVVELSSPHEPSPHLAADTMERAAEANYLAGVVRVDQTIVPIINVQSILSKAEKNRLAEIISDMHSENGRAPTTPSAGATV